MIRRFVGAGVVVGALAILGCGDLPPEADSAAGPAAPAAPAPAPPGDPAAASDNVSPEDTASPAAGETTDTAVAPVDSDMPAENDGAAATDEVAGVGVGAKGQDYGGPGFVTTPVEAYFRTGERIAFEVQIPKAMQLYKASHNNKGPKSHEEFMNVIIKENGVQLPELPEGEEFLYDPETEQLMVRKPSA